MRKLRRVAFTAVRMQPGASVSILDRAATHSWLRSGVFSTVDRWRICDAGVSSRRRLGSLALFLDAWRAWSRFNLILNAWRVWFDLAAFWISGVRGQASASF